jgi:spore germination protein
LSYERWNKTKWETIYSNLNFVVKVNVDLVNTGKSR